MTSRYSCAECRERLPWYAAGTLPPGERNEVEGHLAGCDACRREVALWRAVGAALDGMVAEPPTTALEGMTWRAIQVRIEAAGRPSASDSGNLKERSLMDDESGSIAPAPGMPRRGSAGPSRRQPFVALAAAVLIIAVSVTLFGVYGAWTRQSGSSTATAATTCAPGQARAHLPAYTVLRDISMVSATDGWAVGQVWNSNVSGSTPRTIIMRYQHCAWSETGKSIPSASLYSVAMNSASDGWALGATAIPAGTFWSPGQLILLHYTGGSWRRVQFNSDNGFRGGAFSMYSPNDGWLGLVYSGGTQTSLIYHYQDGKWTPVALPDAVHSVSITDLVAGGPDDAWIVGNVANNVATIGHYSAGQWQTWQAPLIGGRNPMLSAIHVSSPQDVWALGRYSYTFSSQGAGGYTDGPYVLHYNGTDWNRVPVGNLGSPGSPPPDVMFFATTISLPDGGFLALGSDTPFSEASGLAPQHTLVLRCSASGCQPQAFPVANVRFVQAVSLYAPTQGFAIGYERESLSTPATSILLTYNAGDWAPVPA